MRDEVVDPDGVRWVIRRHWRSYELHWWAPRGTGGLDFSPAGGFDGAGIVIGIVLFFAAVLLVFLVLPAMLLLVQLLVIAVLFTSSMAGKVLLGRPWEIEAIGSNGRRRRWLIRGWNASSRAITHIAWALQTGSAVVLPDGGQEAP